MDNIKVSKLTRRLRCEFSTKEFASYAIGPADRKQLCINVCESCAKGMLEGLTEILKADRTKIMPIRIYPAVPASDDGLTAAIACVADISDISEWFKDATVDGAALGEVTYETVNSDAVGAVMIEDGILTFVPASEDANCLRRITVKATDGTNEGDVEIDVEVAGVPADEGQEPKDGEPGDEPKDDTPKDEVKATGGTNEASAENIYTCRYCGKTFDKTPEELKNYRAHSMTCARTTKAAEEAAKAAAAGAE
jgi:hypothetical protein